MNASVSTVIASEMAAQVSDKRKRKNAGRRHRLAETRQESFKRT